jgi:hypothetical protein
LFIQLILRGIYAFYFFHFNKNDKKKVGNGYFVRRDILEHRWCGLTLPEVRVPIFFSQTHVSNFLKTDKKVEVDPLKCFLIFIFSFYFIKGRVAQIFINNKNALLAPTSLAKAYICDGWFAQSSKFLFQFLVRLKSFSISKFKYSC